MRARLVVFSFLLASATAEGGCGSKSTSTAGDSATTTTHADSSTDSAPPATTCTPPISAADISTPTTVVGTGTAASCTESALAAAVAAAGVITFNCGGPATIAITQQLELSITKDTVIDGGGEVTLDGGGVTRVLDFKGTNYRVTTTTVTLQHLTIAHGKATGSAIPTAPAPCSQGYNIDGAGGGIYINDGILHVIDVTFDSNQAASPGPDVGGGGIYAAGSLGVVVVGSTFTNNSGSNSGAEGSLNSDLTLVNDTFTGNQATGSGENYISASCPVNGGESGNGGNAGAVGIDGGSDGTVTICGCTFSNNSAGALAGALGRTPDNATQATNIDLSTFDLNQSVSGGGAIYMHNSLLNITGTTFSNNSSVGAGAIQADSTTFTFTNDTFAANSAVGSLGGAIALFSDTGTEGTLTNCTFANNHADKGSGYFAAAIAGGTALTINNTIFWDNTSQDCGSPMTCSDDNSTGSADLQWPTAHIVCTGADPACVANITFADAQLGALANNGGQTLTMLPGASSPAIGIGKACPPTDQRGNARATPNGCTAGAVEVQ